MKGMTAIAFILLAAVSGVFANGHYRTTQYGKPGELEGVTRIYLDIGQDETVCQIIQKELKKKLPTIQLVSTPEEAEIILEFSLEVSKTEVSGNMQTRQSTGVSIIVAGPRKGTVIEDTAIHKSAQIPHTRTHYYGSGRVYKSVSESQDRILFELIDEREYRERKSAPKEFIKKFIKEFKRYNPQLK